MKLMTIGYEGATLQGFLSTLQRADVSIIADIRELPISRKPGFAKTRLSSALNASNIEYIHLRDLGDPKLGREAARSGKYDLFREIFDKHLASERAQIALSKLIAISQEHSTCLLCYEREPNLCHRSIVAERIRRTCSTKVHHLRVSLYPIISNESRKDAA